MRRQVFLTEAEVRAVRAVVTAGSIKAGAANLGLVEQTVKNHLHSAYRRNEADGLMDLLIRLGWLRVPD